MTTRDFKEYYKNIVSFNYYHYYLIYNNFRTKKKNHMIMKNLII